MNEKQNRSDNNDLYTEEIDLYDILRKIWKWKFLTIAVIIIFMVATFLHVKSTPEMYTSESIIKVGKIANVLIEQIPDIHSYIQSDICNTFSSCANTLNCSPISQINSNTDKVLITSKNNSPEKSFSCIQEAVKSLLKRHDIIYKNALKKINENISSIKTKEIIDPVYFLESYTAPTAIIKQPLMPVNPDSKKTAIKLAVAFFASLFIGIFLSFFLEYILMHRKKL
ncbi:MAG: hypothetical protein JW864_01720 [Spirochaetes bacterium]|nr:hypothetical protein [Spirochaetota bacterium]